MKGYSINIEKKTLENKYFRQVLHTEQHCQLVVMSLKPKEEIGVETHQIVDQFIRVEKGQGKAIIGGEEHTLTDGSVVIVPAATKHNIINTSATEEMKLYTVYAPAHHRKDTLHKTKAEAEKDKKDYI